MFAKLLKYDMKSVGKIGWPCVIATFGVGVVGFLIASLLSTLLYFIDDVFIWQYSVYASSESAVLLTIARIVPVVYIFSIIGIMLLLIGVIILASILGTAILVITVVNFYKTLLTDEGYLTFTLPVSPTKILLSKLLNSVIWNIIMTIAQVFCIVALMIPFFILSIASTPSSDLAPTMGNIALEDVINVVITVLGYIFTFVLMGVFVVVSAITSQLLYFLAVFLGGVVAKKQKLLAGAGFIVAGQVIFNVIQRAVSFVVAISTFVLAIIVSALTAVILPDFSVSISMISIQIVSLLINIVIFGVIGAVLFVITNYLMNKKLNLP